MEALNICIISDLHLRNTEKYGKVGPSGLNSRLEDKLNHIKTSVKYTVDSKLDYWICLGDLFDKINPAENLRDSFFECITPLIENEIPIIVLVGNHDTDSNIYSLMTEARIFRTLKKDSIQLIAEPKIETIKGHKFLFLPWMDDDQISYQLRQEKDCIVLGHFGVDGSSVGVTEYKLSSGVSPKLFEQHKMGILGHYHKYQWNDNWGYIGSIARVDFSERKDPKGFAHLILGEDKPQLKFIEVEERKFFQHNIAQKEDPNFEELAKWDESNIKDAIVKLVFIGEENWYLGFNPNEVRNKLLKQLEAHKLFIEHHTKTSGRFLMPEINISSDWSEGIELHCAAKKRPDMIELGKKILMEVQGSEN